MKDPAARNSTAYIVIRFPPGTITKEQFMFLERNVRNITLQTTGYGNVCEAEFSYPVQVNEYDYY